MCQFGIAAHDAHTATAAAAGGFDNNGITDALRMSAVSVHVVAQRAVRARDCWYASFLHRGNCGHFVAHQADGVGFRADEDKAGTFYLFSKVGILREEAIALVNCHCAGDFSSANDSGMFR